MLMLQGLSHDTQKAHLATQGKQQYKIKSTRTYLKQNIIGVKN